MTCVFALSDKAHMCYWQVTHEPFPGSGQYTASDYSGTGEEMVEEEP